MSEVKLPALGESVTEGTITRWLKKVGDTVAIDEALVEVSTDKVDTEIPSPVAGVLQQILVQEDEVALVGAVLAIIGDGVASSTPPAATPPVVETPVVAAPVVAAPVLAAPVVEAPVVAAPVVVTPPVVAAPVVAPVVADPPSSLPVFTPQVSTPVVPATTNTDPSYVTPLVRKLAAESGVNLSSVAGTGVGGRIRREDVLTAASGASSAPAKAPAFTAAPSALRGTVEPMSRLRKVLGERAVASMVSSAQLTTVVEVDVTKIAQLRTKVQAEFTAKTGVKLNFMPFFFLAAAEALRTNPKINAAIDGENIVYHATENISFAVDTERGLLTPVIRDAASLSLGVIAQQIADMAARTRENKLKPDELSGGTFTLTNTGSRGALFDTPVVFLPQSAILGTGVVSKRPVVVTDENGQDSIAIRSMVYLALSYDHRIIDGADASRFLVEVKTRLEEANFQANFGF
jgi:pyruvate dehydrogenase E2 component (dihydrolipoamide acetyltransferase)